MSLNEAETRSIGHGARVTSPIRVDVCRVCVCVSVRCLSGWCAFVCCCFACDFVLLLEVFRVRFARVSCPRLKFVNKLILVEI